VFGDRNANVFFSGLDIIEQAKLNTGSVLGKDCKVDAVPRPGRAQGIGIAKKSAYRSHKCAAHLSGMQCALANTNTMRSREEDK
jgi:hypothetical protein